MKLAIKEKLQKIPILQKITKKHLPYIIAGALLIGVGVYFGASSAVQAATAKKELPIYSVQRDDKVVAISFDAAWGDEDTADIIKALADYNVKTTFFVVGNWVDKYPHQVKALHEAGHEIMNHSDTHPHMTKLSLDEMRREINRCNDKIEAITGVRPNLFRPPYGDYNNAVIQAMHDMGMYTIQWDVDSLDWKDLTEEQIVARVVPKVTPGSIVLFHNGAKHTAKALPMILDGLQKAGYTIVKVSEIIYYDNYTIDHTGRQIPTTSIN
jgi:polysaccharide deacetylase family sporulation protein PdaB